MNKRDGSHWELFDCLKEHTEERQTVKAVCANNDFESNCNDIYIGTGVARKVVELPDGCGPGRYAVAVGLEPSKDQSLPGHLRRRGLEGATVYDFTFDYDFAQFEKRGDKTNVLLRIDYSDDPGYWDQVVGEYYSNPLFHKTYSQHFR
jgi:chitinase